MAGHEIAGAQSQRLIVTAKHFAMNDEETDRVVREPVSSGVRRMRIDLSYRLAKSRCWSLEG